MISMKYFLYGNGANCAKKLTGVNINSIAFNYTFITANYNYKLCDSKFLNRNFCGHYVIINQVNGHIIDIDIV